MTAQLQIPHMVLQSTQVCNFNCTYCYLPDRQVRGFMRPDVATAVANSLANCSANPTIINWHAGEPLATGRKRFLALLQPFEHLREDGRLIHTMQTNASLIDDAWCEIFSQYGIQISASIDGHREANAQRVDWQGRETFDATMQGLETLKRNGIPFSMLAVVNTASMRDPHGFYKFFLELGCTGFGLNVEEQEGFHAGAPELDSVAVRHFWKELWEAWIANPTMGIREFSLGVQWSRFDPESLPLDQDSYSYWPTVSLKGDVFLLSPELAAAKPEDRKRFVVGNVLTEPLDQIVARAKDVWYVREYFEGAEKCRETCKYYTYCRGGLASNKFFETGKFNVTETNDCRFGQQAIVDTMFEAFDA